MEKEICKREIKVEKQTDNKRYKLGFIIAIAYFALSLVITLVICFVEGHGDFEYLFEMDEMWPGHLNILIGLVGSIVFGTLTKKNYEVFSYSIVLTNKRIYVFNPTQNGYFSKSYNLDKIISYSFNKIIKEDKELSILAVSTVNDTANYSVDEEFYNEFVKAINGEF